MLKTVEQMKKKGNFTKEDMAKLGLMDGEETNTQMNATAGG